MDFCFYPNHEHGCPHVAHCPHLGGAALGTLVLAASENGQTFDTLHGQLDAARKSVSELLEENEQLKKQLEQASRGRKGNSLVPRAGTKRGRSCFPAPRGTDKRGTDKSGRSSFPDLSNRLDCSNAPWIPFLSCWYLFSRPESCGGAIDVL